MVDIFVTQGTGIPLQKLGVQILKQPFHVAFSVLTATAFVVEKQVVWDSLIFIQGSALDLTIQTYGLHVDPQALRETFFQWVHTQRRRMSASSSATTTAPPLSNGVYTA